MLTDRQAAVLQFIRDFIEVKEKPPTVREIQRHFALGSPNSVACYLAALERKGEILRTPRESRNIRVLNKRTTTATAPGGGMIQPDN